MDTAALAAQSDPSRNVQFRCPWTGPPPQNRKRPPPPQRGAHFGVITNQSTGIIATSDRSAKRAVGVALRRAAEIERQALALHDIGKRDAALRRAEIAAELRAVTG